MSLKKELLEQARLNGMGAERELHLIAKVERLKRLLLKARAEVEYWTPDESNATADESEWLNNWYSLRDAIDEELRDD